MAGLGTVIDVLPAATPPEGIQSNLVNPPSKGPVGILVGSIFTFIMLVTLFLRFYARFVVTRQRSWDDLTVALSGIFTTAFFVDLCFACTLGKNGTHNWDVTLGFVMSQPFQITSYIAQAWTCPVYLTTKLTFFFIYLHLFQPYRWMRIANKIGIVFTSLFYTTMFIYMMINTTPNPGETFAEEAIERPSYGSDVYALVPMAIVGLAIDIYIFVLPMLAIRQLGLSLRKKLGLFGIFGVGILAIVCSSMSVMYRIELLQDHEYDFVFKALPVLLCFVVEMCCGVIAACLPSTIGLVKHPHIRGWFDKVTGRSSSTSRACRTVGTTGAEHQRFTGGSHVRSGTLHSFAKLRDDDLADFEMHIRSPPRAEEKDGKVCNKWRNRRGSMVVEERELGNEEAEDAQGGGITVTTEFTQRIESRAEQSPV